MSIFNKPGIPTQANILLTTELSLRDIKAEMVLSFANTLFEDYYRLKENKDEQIIINLDEAKGEQEIIDKTIKELHEYCNKRTTSVSQLRNIISKAERSEKDMLLAKSVEPMATYVDRLIKSYISYLKEGQQYIPDYLGVLLISLYRDTQNKIYVAHPYIQEYNLNPYLELFKKKNALAKEKAKQENPKLRVWENKTAIDRMERISANMIESYVDFKYKTNITRVSKERSKKKKRK